MTDENELVLEVVRRLREIREAQGVSQYRLSKDTGLSPSGIRHMENGDVSPTLYFLLRISSRLRVNLSTLLADTMASRPGQITHQPNPPAS